MRSTSSFTCERRFKLIFFAVGGDDARPPPRVIFSHRVCVTKTSLCRRSSFSLFSFILIQNNKQSENEHIHTHKLCRQNSIQTPSSKSFFVPPVVKSVQPLRWRRKSVLWVSPRRKSGKTSPRKLAKTGKVCALR